jgi:alpha-amylase/alpha-mannosidase (GH57 family)
MPYHHVILPLCPRRDKTTEVRWGIADFQRRFGREPEGMWLPETAVDHETLDVLAEEGIRFTILAPHQVERAPVGGLPGWYRTAGDRRIAIFTYDGGLSHGVAFGPLVNDAGAWIERLTAAPGELVSIATDGETYGHHHKNGIATLARVVETIETESFASFLARRPPEEEVRLVSPSSWSCPHGVERWRAECGCRAAPERGTQQRWRAPLRAALDWLSEEIRSAFEREARVLPTALEHQLLRMFTSCGWFFDDIAGIESVIVLRSAARAIELAGPIGAPLEAGLLERLAEAPSNDPAVGSGRELYLQRVKV